MRIRVTGARTPTHKRHLKQMVQFVISHRLSEKDQQDLKIHIKFMENEEFVGMCEVHDYEARRPKRFTIYLTATQYRFKSLLATVAHETVHLCQYASGRMRHVQKGRVYKTKFDGVLYDELDESTPEGKVGYWLQPWEIEAHGLERGMLNLYLEEQGLKRLLTKYD